MGVSVDDGLHLKVEGWHGSAGIQNYHGEYFTP